MVARSVWITGKSQVKASLGRLSAEVESLTPVALDAGALIIAAEAKRRTPVDTGNLVNSQYTSVVKNRATIGYLAAYALQVHETDRKYRKPGSSWKFLSGALDAKRDEAADMIQKIISTAF